MIYRDDFDGPVFILGDNQPTRCIGTIDEIHAEDCYYNDWRWTTNSARDNDNSTGPNVRDGVLHFRIPAKSYPSSGGYYQANFIQALGRP